MKKLISISILLFIEGTCLAAGKINPVTGRYDLVGDAVSSSGGGTTVWVKKDSVALDNAVSTMNVITTNGLTVTSSPSGQVNINVDTTTIVSASNAMTQASSTANDLKLSSAASTYQPKGNYLTSVNGYGPPVAVGSGTYTNFTNVVSSPAYALSFEGGQFRLSQIGSTTYIVIDTITANGLMVISSMTLYMSQSSSTLNSLTLSSAAATYFQKNNIYIASATAGASILIRGSNNVAGGSPIFDVNSSSFLALGNNLQSNSNIHVTSASVDNTLTVSTMAAVTVYIATNPAKPPQFTGAVFWDKSEDSLAYFNASGQTTVNIGQENLLRVTNITGATIVNGMAVYLSSAAGGLPTVALARADVSTTATVVGVATMDIPNNTTGYITNVGIVHDLNMSAYSPGAMLYLSSITAGNLTAAAPSIRSRVGIAVSTNSTAGTLLLALGAPASSYYIVQDEGTELTRRTILNCVGTAITCSDDSANSRTLVTVTASAAGAVNISSGPTFASTNTVTVTNTGTETSIRGLGYGSSTFTANAMYVGETIKIYLSGLLSDDAIAPGTLNLKLKLGGSTIAVTGAFAPPVNLLNDIFELNGLMTVRSIGASGSVMINTLIQFKDATGFVTDMQQMINTVAVPIDTTKAVNDVDATVTWGTADTDNVFTCTNFVVDNFNGNIGSTATSGGTGSIDVSTGGSLVAVSTSMNFIAGAGVTVTATNSGGRTNLTFATTVSTRSYQWDAASFQTLESSFPVILSTGSGNMFYVVRICSNSATREYVNGKFILDSHVVASGTATFTLCGRSSVTSSANVAFTFDEFDTGTAQTLSGAYASYASGDKALTTGGDILTCFSWQQSVNNMGWNANDLINFRLSRTDPSTTELAGDFYLMTFKIDVPVQ